MKRLREIYQRKVVLYHRLVVVSFFNHNFIYILMKFSMKLHSAWKNYLVWITARFSSPPMYYNYTFPNWIPLTLIFDLTFEFKILFCIVVQRAVDVHCLKSGMLALLLTEVQWHFLQPSNFRLFICDVFFNVRALTKMTYSMTIMKRAWFCCRRAKERFKRLTSHWRFQPCDILDKEVQQLVLF